MTTYLEPKEMSYISTRLSIQRSDSCFIKFVILYLIYPCLYILINVHTLAGQTLVADLTTTIPSAAPSAIVVPNPTIQPTASQSNFADQQSSQRSNAADYSLLHHSRSLYPKNAQGCQGRTRLTSSSGYITDGHGNYTINTQCQWLIDSGQSNATIRIRILSFDTECNYDYLYIFDGDSMFAPLVASLSGPITNNHDRKNKYSRESNKANWSSPTKEGGKGDFASNTMEEQLWTSATPEIVTTSGSAFVYFHSDTAQSMPGFNISYSINSCPLDCSGHGTCDGATLQCVCSPGFRGFACQFEECPNNCSSSTGSGKCDSQSKQCICSSAHTGDDCSTVASLIDAPEDRWTLVDQETNSMNGRAFHEAVTLGNTMWVVGGKTSYSTVQSVDHHRISNRSQRVTVVSPIMSFDLINEKWTFVEYNQDVLNLIEFDPLVDLFGHSVVAFKQSLYVYGGMTGSMVVNLLMRFDTTTSRLDMLKSITQDTDNKSAALDEDYNAPVAVFGHSANVVDQFMYIFFGYNPTLGYVDWVQKYDFESNSWSLVKTGGSSVDGCVGHSSVYDSASHMVFVYGGHHVGRSSAFYAFDVRHERWTFLQPAPTPRFYHRAVIVNNLMLVIGGNTYNSSTQEMSEDCLDSHTLLFDLTCVNNQNQAPPSPQIAVENMQIERASKRMSTMSRSLTCNSLSSCWRTLDDTTDQAHISRRYGHSIVLDDSRKNLYLFGGFNGLILKSTYRHKLERCSDFNHDKLACERPKLSNLCRWTENSEQKCLPSSRRQQSSKISSSLLSSTNDGTESKSDPNDAPQCTDTDVIKIQRLCESRQTCADCLFTSLGCRWCPTGQCKFDKCPGISSATQVSLSGFNDPEQCTQLYNDGSNITSLYSSHVDTLADFECRRTTDCYMCQTKNQCVWQSECVPRRTSPMHIGPLMTPLPQPQASSSSAFSSAQPTPNPSLNMIDDIAHIGNSTLSGLKNVTEKTSKATLTLPGQVADLLSALTRTFNVHSETCDSPCYRRHSCKDCVANKCIWCTTTNECLDSSAYLAYYPIGQCMHYVAHYAKCHGSSCSDLETCEQCLKNPKCGWIDDGTQRGTGQCIEGTSRGPLAAATFNNSAIHSLNKHSNWYFDGCPLCQCNGHSTCRPGSNICIKPCANHTEGAHCERCQSGYFGNPINGGTCHECQCHSHATTCNRETGKCYCSTKGIVGHNCNKCDEQNHYLGDSSNMLNGTCYYNLTTDYQYTFNMSKPDDFNYSDINFMSIPTRRDADVDFTISCSGTALVNISSGLAYRFGPSYRTNLYSNVECGAFKIKFPYEQLLSSTRNYTFYVNVYGFQTPFVLQISFSQHRTIDLWQFFFTFSSCFLFLTVIVGIVWKLRQRYSLYRRRQQQFVEMEQMASRPFVTVLLDLTPGKKSEMMTSVTKQSIKQKMNLNNDNRSLTGDGVRLEKMDEIEHSNSITNQDHTEPTLETQLGGSKADPRCEKFAGVNYHRLDANEISASTPTPIAIEPCASGQAGVVSLLVQLPGRPSLAIASALVSLDSNQQQQQQQSNDTKEASSRARNIKDV